MCCEKESFFKIIIVYGFLIVSLMFKVFVEVIVLSECIVFMINYGIDKLCFFELVKSDDVVKY